MAYQERIKVEFLRQGVLYPGETELRYLMVRSVETGPGEFKVLSNGPEFSAGGFRKLIFLRSFYCKIEGPSRTDSSED